MTPTRPPLDPQTTLGIARERMPRHVAIIMDGNGRWARRKGLARIQGHEQGAQSVRTVVTHAARLGLDVLTLFSFSTENWKRPRQEVEFLMELYARYLVSERETIMDNDVRFLHIGRRDGLPESVLTAMDQTVEMSAGNSGMRLCLALNYGGRDEILEAVRTLARDVKSGRIEAESIDERLFSQSLLTSDLPDPDLLIRTANERRVSNFLLWQISYAEIHVSERHWPEFGEADLEAALIDYAGRDRRFGGVANEVPAP